MRTIDELERGWMERPPSPRDEGVVRLICLRRGGGVHETPERAMATSHGGLEGDRWAKGRPDSDPDGATAVTLINAGVVDLISDGEQPAHAAGDNLVVHLDLGIEALPAGSRLAIGPEVVLRVSEQPHTGCSTFRDKFGLDALKWVSTPAGRARRLRGANCSVERPGTITVGDPIRVVSRPRVSGEAIEAGTA